MNKNQYKEQLDTLQKLGHIGLWEFDFSTQTLNCSDEIYNIFQLDKTNFNPTYENFFNLVHTDDKQAMKDIYINSLQTKKKFKIIHRVLMPDERIKYVEQSGNTIFDEKGNPLVLSGTIHDITELSLAKIELENEHNKLKAILENIPDLLWIKDANGVYITCNRRFEDFFGAKGKDIISKTDYDFVDKELADFFRDNDLKAMNSEKPLSNFEEITFSSDGHKEYIQTTKSKVIDSNGNIIGVLGIGRDLTKLRDKELELLEQQEELQSIYNTTKDGLAIIDMETNFIKVNKSYCDIIGLTQEELLQTSCFALSDPEDIERVKGIFDEFLEKGFIDSFEKVCIIKDRRINVALSAAWMPDKKNILLNMKDITKNKLFEEQSKLAAMGEMIGNIAHQWRQPLSVITTISSGIKIRSEYEQLENYNIVSDMNVIMEQAQYLSQTIDDFRNFIRNSNEVQNLSIKNTVEKTLTILHSVMINNGITIITDLKDDMNINGYENELIQSFINIMNNAKDAIKEHLKNYDEKLIFINTSKENSSLIITIKDNGGGVPHDIIHRIFEPYFTTKNKSVGTGIGLSMSYKMLVERHNASIDISNEEYIYNNKNYKGACFRITFKQ